VPVVIDADESPAVALLDEPQQVLEVLRVRAAHAPQQ